VCRAEGGKGKQKPTLAAAAQDLAMKSKNSQLALRPAIPCPNSPLSG
jgi:hypothetical protein